MKERILFVVLLLMFSECSLAALTSSQLLELTTAAKEMCETPTKEGEKFKVSADVSGGVVIKLVGLKGEAKISKETWSGIENIRETQSDRVKCTQEIVKVLAPLMSSSDETAVDKADLYSQQEKYSENLDIFRNTYSMKRTLYFKSLECFDKTGKTPSRFTRPEEARQQLIDGSKKMDEKYNEALEESIAKIPLLDLMSAKNSKENVIGNIKESLVRGVNALNSKENIEKVANGLREANTYLSEWLSQFGQANTFQQNTLSRLCPQI